MTTDAVGGVWTYALDLARAFRARNIEVIIAGMGPRPPAYPADIDVRWRDYKLEWQDDPWADADRAAEWLLSIEREIEPDLIHLNGYAHAAIPWKAPKLVVAHSCVFSWWEAVHKSAPPPEWNEYHRRILAGIHSADILVAPSRAMLTAIEKHYGLPRATDVIPNGRDPRAFLRSKKEPFVLTAGRLWDSAKNLAALDRAAVMIDWPVHAAGAGNSSNNIHSLGQLSPEQMRDQFARASIYALPARYEPFGLSILEAALSGCALVLGDIASLRENWEGAAVFVDPDDSIELAREIKNLIDSEILLDDLQTKARERAAAFTLDCTADRYLACYAALRCRSHPATAFKS